MEKRYFFAKKTKIQGFQGGIDIINCPNTDIKGWKVKPTNKNNLLINKVLEKLQKFKFWEWEEY